MQRNVIVFLVLISAASSAHAQEWARKMFETTSHDFGAVARGAKSEFRFKLANIYVEDVHISDVRSSCGCTTPTKGPELLKTYDEGFILATFNTKNHLGQKSATLTVTFDKPFPAEVQLQVSGFIRSDVELEPGGVQFGTVGAGEPAEQTLKITARTDRNWQITAIRSSSEFVEAEAVETGRQIGDVTYDLKVRLLPGAPTGYVKERLVVVANDSKSTEFPIEVEGRVQAALSATSHLFMHTVKPAGKKRMPLVVQGKQPFRITSIECDDECFTWECPKTSERRHIVNVTFEAPDEPGKHSAKLRITTDLPNQSVLEVPVMANVVAPEPEEEAAE
ncbi:MAG TPA: DUF1573 domain-containing protein [Pirellulales bacterium]|nr:DUF1573 domain-containing protein [Pirellulales bacterium]